MQTDTLYTNHGLGREILQVQRSSTIIFEWSDREWALYICIIVCGVGQKDTASPMDPSDCNKNIFNVPLINPTCY
jgi:hypothetical protein